MLVEKQWKELLVMMTEDTNGRLKPVEEEALLDMDVVEFFISLLVFKERMDKRTAELKKQKSNARN